MPYVLIAADAPWVHEEIKAALPATPGLTSKSVGNGRAVRALVAEERPALVVVDSQIGNMGGMAVSLDLRNEESGGRLPRVPVLLLLDRQADVFLARRAQADGYLVKPLDPIRVRKAAKALMSGGTYTDRPVLGDATTNFASTPDSAAR